MGKYPWHPYPDKRCLTCGKEELQYKYFDKSNKYCMYCNACKSVWWAKKEDDVKRQHRDGENND